MSSISGLPPTRRIVTGHTPSGKAVFVSDEVFADTLVITPGKVESDVSSAPPPPPPVISEDKLSRFTHLFVTTSHSPLPSNEAGSQFVDIVKAEPSKGELLVPDNGSVVRLVDIPPKSSSPFHRTVSLDYAIVVQGSVVCELDEGVRKTINAGDVFVQRGTIHKWANESETEWVRMFFVMLTSKPVQIEGGKELKTEFVF